jgi:hypothetical protein
MIYKCCSLTCLPRTPCRILSMNQTLSRKPSRVQKRKDTTFEPYSNIAEMRQTKNEVTSSASNLSSIRPGLHRKMMYRFEGKSMKHMYRERILCMTGSIYKCPIAIGVILQSNKSHQTGIPASLVHQSRQSPKKYK